MPLQRKELEPALDLILMAMDKIRMLQPQDLEREQFRGKIYHWLYEASTAIMNDSWVPPSHEARPEPRQKGEAKLPLVEKWKEERAALAADLDLLK